MAVVTKDELMGAIKALVSDNTSDEVLAVVENVSDTMDDLINKSKGDGKDWKKKYEENDAEWRKRYTDRFFSAPAGGTADPSYLNPDGSSKKDPEPEPEEEPHYTYEELFKAPEGKE